VLALAFAPFLFPGSKPLNVAAKICIFIALARPPICCSAIPASSRSPTRVLRHRQLRHRDLACSPLARAWDAIALGLLAALPLAALLALVIGPVLAARPDHLLCHDHARGRGSAFAVFASQLSWLTGGEDGAQLPVPELLQPGTTYIARDVFGIRHGPHI